MSATQQTHGYSVESTTNYGADDGELFEFDDDCGYLLLTLPIESRFEADLIAEDIAHFLETHDHQRLTQSLLNVTELEEPASTEGLCFSRPDDGTVDEITTDFPIMVALEGVDEQAIEDIVEAFDRFLSDQTTRAAWWLAYACNKHFGRSVADRPRAVVSVQYRTQEITALGSQWHVCRDPAETRQ